MIQVVRVEFAGPARAQYCTTGETRVGLGDMVVVETEWGVGMGRVAASLPTATIERMKPPLHPILRKATPTDLSRRVTLTQRERDARAFCRERILARSLPMKLTEVRIGLDSSKAMFYFTAEGRVDFRDLVKDLVQHLRTRVELRQIGVRDEAKVLGCAGACGRPVCCHAFLSAFAPVSIRMAKDQNLALNPGKLSGICGRLKCCLAYEHCLYADLRRVLPKVGSSVVTSRGGGVVRGQNILEQSVMVSLETGGQVTLKVSEISLRPRSDAGGRPQGASHATAARAEEPATAAKPAPREAERGRGRRPRRQAPPPSPPPTNGGGIPRDPPAREDP
jgi:cell fate regulator YaaT (PSP1 superfamily)